MKEREEQAFCEGMEMVYFSKTLVEIRPGSHASKTPEKKRAGRERGLTPCF